MKIHKLLAKHRNDGKTLFTGIIYHPEKGISSIQLFTCIAYAAGPTKFGGPYTLWKDYTWILVPMIKENMRDRYSNKQTLKMSELYNILPRVGYYWNVMDHHYSTAHLLHLTTEEALDKATADAELLMNKVKPAAIWWMDATLNAAA
jgi:hypothetical protein